MAGTTSWIISNLMSMIEKLTPFMHPFPSLPASSSSSSSITPSEANSIQERLTEDLSRLSRMLRRIQAELHDAEDREIYEQAIQLWLTELREVAYDAEDVLEEYDYQVIKAQVEGITPNAEPSLKRKHVDDDDLYGDQASLPSSTLIKIPISHNMAERIIKIVEKFDEIAKDREALQLRPEDAPRRLCLDDATKRPPSSSLVHDSDIFGWEDDKKKIVQLLMSNTEEENTVIPIVGMGGVGKTTLAQLVYNDSAVCKHFSRKAWVCVSENFDVLRITKEIMTSITGSISHLDNLNDLQCKLKEALQEKRFLLILDDVWNERPDMWEALKTPFSGVGMGKIIVTTRSKSVARIMQTMPPHDLRCLGEEKSWLLFRRHAFCGWERDHQLNFEHIGREITKKCGGLPLALKAIGGFLRHEVEEQIWKDVLNNNLWELEQTKNLILPALRISYNHMPGYLKPCFVYASLFPKDHEFEKVELTRMWIAQGYIRLTRGKRLLEDIAFEYVEDLQRRSFFQSSTYDKFILHDMVHDLARSIAKIEICSFLNVDELENIPTDAKHIFIKCSTLDHALSFGAIRTCSYNHPRSLKLYFSDEIPFKSSFSYFGCLRILKFNAPQFVCNLQFVDSIGNLQQLRYLSIDVPEIQMAEYSFCSLYKLQTLELKSNKLNMLPHAIRKLINLRHLVLRCHDQKILPNSIDQLENLITLDIEQCRGLRELPLGISKLTNLRHLILPRESIPCVIEKMTSLQTLPHYYLRRDGQHSGIGWLKDLMNLRGSLNISNLEDVVSREEAESANLISKPHIESLTLSWSIDENDDECASLHEAVLDGLQHHTNLKELTIVGYGGNTFPSWFGNPRFSNLQIICLKWFNSNEEFKFLPLSGLPSLRSLTMYDIKGVRRIQQDFWCYPPPDGREKNLTEVHVGFLHSLEYLTIKKMPAWTATVKNRDFSTLKCLCITLCPQLKLLSTLPSNLEELTVFSCVRLEYLALHESSGPLSRLQTVIISYCGSLKSVKSLDNVLATLNSLNLNKCPLLQPNQDDYSHHSLASLSLKQDIVDVYDCPGMREWCGRHGFTYI